jgi:hypothetical protein
MLPAVDHVKRVTDGSQAGCKRKVIYYGLAYLLEAISHQTPRIYV